MLGEVSPSARPIPGPPLAARGCTHCGEPLAAQVFTNDAGALFCCKGCLSVYAILKRAGLASYYDHREASGGTGRKVTASGKSYREMDEPEFTALYCHPSADGRLSTTLYLEGVHCSACVWLVEKVGALAPGVTESRLDLPRALVHLTWDPAQTPLSRIAGALDSLGYPCHPLEGLDREAIRRREDRALLMRVGVAGAAAGNAMMLAIALYSGAADGMAAEHAALFRWASAVVAAPAVLWSAGVFYRGALGALRTLTPHMDLPITLGILIGTASGVWNVARGGGEIYFDTLTMLIFLLLVGRHAQVRQQRRADGTAELLHALSPKTARVVEGGRTREVPVETVPLGGLVEIRAGEQVPIDGLVLEGESAIDASLLTGESMPAEVGPGARVSAGTVNVAARLLVRAEKTGRSTRVARVLASVEEAAARRAPIVIAANRLSGWFVGVVLTAAAITVLGWWHVDPSQALERAVALLVVTCPCALALATPLAVSAALGQAARVGLLVKGGEALEALAEPGLVVFDKTGTLTAGKLTLIEYQGDETARPLVAAVEARSAHPIARALSAALGEHAAIQVQAMRETPGGGVEAVADGHEVIVGSAPFVLARAAGVPPWVVQRSRALAGLGQTPVLVAIDGAVAAVAALGDPVRPEARACLEELARMGHRLAILSGDQPAVAHAIAAQIGARFESVVGGAGPEAKLAFIEEHTRRGRVFMVGDGVNDAAALSAASVGIAVHGGAEASLSAADVFATRAGLEPIVQLFTGARRTMRVIRGNLARSLVYNLTVGVLAALGVVGPLLAAVLMPVSSISVVAASYRARTFGDRK